MDIEEGVAGHETVTVEGKRVIRQNIIIYRAMFYSVTSYQRPTNGIQQLTLKYSAPPLLGRRYLYLPSKTRTNRQTHGHRQATFLQSVLETWLTLNHLATSIHTLVGSPELEGECEGDENDEAVGDHAGHDSWAITWGIDLTEDSCERVSLCSLWENI